MSKTLTVEQTVLNVLMEKFTKDKDKSVDKDEDKEEKSSPILNKNDDKDDDSDYNKDNDSKNKKKKLSGDKDRVDMSPTDEDDKDRVSESTIPKGASAEQKKHLAAYLKTVDKNGDPAKVKAGIDAIMKNFSESLCAANKINEDNDRNFPFRTDAGVGKFEILLNKILLSGLDKMSTNKARTNPVINGTTLFIKNVKFAKDHVTFDLNGTPHTVKATFTKK